MPTIAHRLQPRILEDSNGNGGISNTAIALIVVLGILPALVLAWTVCYLFWAYPYDRNCCCIKRKRRAKEPEAPLSEETTYEKPVLAPPQRPYTGEMRTESGNSSNSGRLTKQQRPGSGVTKYDTRMSQQSVASTNTIQVSQEPQRFV
jgi:hypothetical protein